MNNTVPTSSEVMDRLDKLTPAQIRVVAYWLADADPVAASAACDYATLASS